MKEEETGDLQRWTTRKNHRLDESRTRPPAAQRDPKGASFKEQLKRNGSEFNRSEQKQLNSRINRLQLYKLQSRNQIKNPIESSFISGYISITFEKSDKQPRVFQTMSWNIPDCQRVRMISQTKAKFSQYAWERSFSPSKWILVMAIRTWKCTSRSIIPVGSSCLTQWEARLLSIPTISLPLSQKFLCFLRLRDAVDGS